jgi:predicted negative regulator of RcsB-dependent stress response
MATLQTDEANILDAETINWQIVVFPLLAVLIIAGIGFGYYYYQIEQREELEQSVRDTLVEAKTPEDMIKIAQQYPNTDQATLAWLSAADASFAKRDFDATIHDYQQVIATPKVAPDLADTAQLGLGSAFEAAGKPNDAIQAYMTVAGRGTASPFAPYAYCAAARIYEARGDKTNEELVLKQAASLDPDSNFVKQAQLKLKMLDISTAPNAATPTPAAPSPSTAPAPVAPPPPAK